MKRFFLSHFILLSFLSCATAQSKTIKLKMYSSDDGLSNNVIRNIEQDKFGRIWIGTEYGLNRFDGITFTHFLHDQSDENSLSNNQIFGLDSDKNGIVWVGTDEGVNAYNPATNEFTAFRNTSKSSSLSNDHVRAVFVDKSNNVWVGTEDGLNLFNRTDSTFQRIMDDRSFNTDFGRKNLSYNRINAITQSLDGRIWVGSDGGGVKVYTANLESVEMFKLVPNQSTYLFDIVRTIYQDTDGEMWFGCDGGICRMDNNNQFSFFTPKNHPDSLGNQFIWSVTEYSPGQLWFGSYGGGLFVFDKEENKFSSHKTLSGRSEAYENNLIWPIFKDNKDNIWVGFDGVGGLGYFSEGSRKFDHLLSPQRAEEKHNVSHVYEISTDSILVNTSKDRLLLVDDIVKVSLDYLFAGLSTDPITVPLKDGFLFTGKNQLILTDKKLKIKHKVEDGQIGMIRCGLQDEDGIIWLGSLASGLIRLDPQTLTIKRYFTEGHLNIFSDSRSISSLHLENDSILWLGPTRFGLVKFNTKTETHQQFLYHTDGLKEPTINSIIEDNEGTLLLGTNENGLIRFDPKSNTSTPSKYLGADLIQSMILDKKNRVWASTIKGLVMLDLEKDSLVRFGMDDGLQSMIFNQNGHLGESGYLYFGGENGINRFDPLHILLDSKTTPLLIEDIQINNTSYAWSLDKPLASISDIKLKHDENDLQISFSSNNYLHTSTHKFEYSINSAPWQSLGTRAELNLSNLAHGTYAIRIRSLNHDMFASPEKELTISIAPPWYDTILFKFAFSIAIVAIAVAIYRYRLRAEKMRNQFLESQVMERTKELELSKKQVEDDKILIEKSLKERESLLKEIHHRVKNNLQIIASLLYLQSGKFKDEDFKKVLEEGQGRVRSMALIHQKLYENDDLKSIPFNEYLQELVSEIRASFGSEMTKISLDIHAENVFFDVDTAVPLGLIVNELATNAFKYAFNDKPSGSFSIFLAENEGTYTLNIKDDGNGIPEEVDIRKTKSLGLRLVRMLSQQLEGDFEIKNENGTCFELKFAA